MTYPLMNVPEFLVKLVSRKEPILCRPFLVGEEKILLMAQESQSEADMVQAVNQIVKACTSDKISAATLPAFDLEYLILQLRAKSVSEIVDIKYVCRNKVNDVECKSYVPFSINLNDIKIDIPAGHSNKIWLNDNVGVTLRYPTIEIAKKLTDSPDSLLTDVLLFCLETVFMKDGTVIECQAQPEAQTRVFLESLTIQQAESLRVFFDTMPTLSHTFEFKCPTCGYTEMITLAGLADFFV